MNEPARGANASLERPHAVCNTGRLARQEGGWDSTTGYGARDQRVHRPLDLALGDFEFVRELDLE